MSPEGVTPVACVSMAPGKSNELKLDCALERGFKDTVDNIRTATEDRNLEFITHLSLDLLPAICARPGAMARHLRYFSETGQCNFSHRFFIYRSLGKSLKNQVVKKSLTQPIESVLHFSDFRGKTGAKASEL